MGGEGVEIPAFYSRESGVRVSTLCTIAEIVSVQFTFN
jgi:pseudouridine-5'-phosphate glycosidase